MLTFLFRAPEKTTHGTLTSSISSFLMRIVAGATSKALDGRMALFAMHAAEKVILGTP